MSDEHFLARWSRRKRDAAADPARPGEAGEKAQPSTQADTQDSAPVVARPAPVAQPAAPDLDLTKLPSLDSITATTDVGSFLAPGVPASLTREALRRAWAADPAIRDFRGLQEYDWDFTSATAVPGFGELGPEYDVKRMVARVFGEDREEPVQNLAGVSEEPGQTIREADESGTAQAAAVEPVVARSHDGGDSDPQSGTDEVQKVTVSVQQSEEFLQRNKEIAMQHDDVPDDRQRKTRRSQGGALPKT